MMQELQKYLTKDKIGDREIQLRHIATDLCWNPILSYGENEQILSEKYGAKILTAGANTEIVSYGEFSEINSVGDRTKIISHGALDAICSNGSETQIISTGDCSKILVGGNYSKVKSTGTNSIIMCSEHGCVVSAKKGSYITLTEWKYRCLDSDDAYKRGLKITDRFIPLCVKTEIVDGIRIKEDTPYFIKNGEFVEYKNEKQLEVEDEF